MTVEARAVSPEASYRAVNGAAWAALAAAGCDSSRPFGASELQHAAGWVCPEGWLPWEEIGTILCLASGGGQQAPALAMLGYDVVVVDLSPEQLARDRQVADAFGIALECIEADMLDLSALYGRSFDLVYQPISACYVPDVEALYREVAAVLAPGGWYDVEHWNPAQVQLASSWDGSAYVVAHPQGSGEPIVSLTSTEEQPEGDILCWHYAHRLHDLIGGLCRAGFSIHRLAERPIGDLDAAPGSHEHMAAYVPAFFRILARLTSPA